MADAAEGGASEGGAEIVLESVADAVETALLQPGKVVAFPRYELRHIPLVGAEAFFLRLAFLQERYLKTAAEGRGRPFETGVESLLRWANVGRATLHRFKKGDPGRGQQPAAGWFGIEQLPSPPRSRQSQKQPPCRYRVQQGIPLTPMDADRLRDQLLAAGILTDPLQALQTLCSRPLQELLVFPPPPPSVEQKQRAPVFSTVSSLVQALLNRKQLPADLLPQIQEWTNKLAEHVTLPQQLVFVSWYFLQHWLPLLGHDAAALVLYTRAQGYYNPQSQELRDLIPINGGYSELAQVSGLRRDRTIGDWLPNIFERQPRGKAQTGESEKWEREQQRQQQIQARIGAFLQVEPGSRKKMPAGHYAFELRVEIQGEPLTPADQGLREWVYQTLAACRAANVLEHFYTWATRRASIAKAAVPEGAEQNDGVGILGEGQPEAAGAVEAAHNAAQNDVWGILAAQSGMGGKMTAGESIQPAIDGWGILEGILNDGLGILEHHKMTVGELFKGLNRLNTYWESILQELKTTPPAAPAEKEVVQDWNLRQICQRNGGINPFREQILGQESSARPFLSWLLYAYSFKGRGIHDPVGWALARLREQPGQPAEGIFSDLAALSTEELCHFLQRHVTTGQAPYDARWQRAFRDVPGSRLRELAEVLAVE